MAFRHPKSLSSVKIISEDIAKVSDILTCITNALTWLGTLLVKEKKELRMVPRFLEWVIVQRHQELV